MNKGYRIEDGALHFDATVRGLECEHDRHGRPTRVIAMTDEGVVAVPWNEIPLMPCPFGGHDIRVRDPKPNE